MQTLGPIRDFDKMATDLSNAAEKLAQAGDPQSDARLTTALVTALKGKAWRTTRTVIDRSICHLRESSVNSFFNDEEQAGSRRMSESSTTCLKPSETTPTPPIPAPANKTKQ